MNTLDRLVIWLTFWLLIVVGCALMGLRELRYKWEEEAVRMGHGVWYEEKDEFGDKTGLKTFHWLIELPKNGK